MTDSILDLDSLLDSTLDDLEDLPSFSPYPVGVHQALATFELKEIGGKNAIELSFKYIEALALGNEQDEAPKAGDEASCLFFLDNKWGLGEFKKCAAPFAAALNLSSNRDILEGVTDVECAIVTTLQANKKDPDSPYMKVKEITVV